MTDYTPKRSLPSLIPHIIYICVNALFCAKYGQRVTPDHYLWIVGVVACLHFCMLWWIVPYLQTEGRWKKSLIGFGLLSILCMIGVQYIVDPEEILVDRWSALHNPISYLLQGRYPYAATTHLGGYASPFPVWQIFHIPFYLMGNVGLSLFFSLGFFLLAIRHTWGNQKALCAMLMVSAAPAFWYEVSVRSDLITNMLLTAGICICLLPHISAAWLEKHTHSTAIVCALLACTRVIALLPIGILLFPYWLQLKPRRQILLVAIATFTFVLTFLPFVLWDWQRFFLFEYNPWALQTRQGNAWAFLVYVPLFFLLALHWRGNSTVYLRSTVLMLTLFVFITIGLNMLSSANYDLFSSSYDITYFSTALPFCIAALCAEKS